MGAMAVVVHRIGVIVDEVVAPGIFAGKVRVGVVEAGVNDPDLNAAACVALLVDQVSANARDAPRIGVFEGVDGEVRLDQGDIGVVPQPVESRLRQGRCHGRYEVVGVADLAAESADQSFFRPARLLVERDEHRRFFHAGCRCWRCPRRKGRAGQQGG